MTKKILIALYILVLVSVACAVALLPKKSAPETSGTQPASTQASSDIHTWEDYLALSPEERESFYQQFDSAEAFDAWAASVNPESTIPFSLTWDKSGKEPDEYTWEEYQALSHEDQEKFYQWFDSAEAFEQWLAFAQPKETTIEVTAWDKPGKAPNEYTWEEYQALSIAARESFYLWFDSADAFNQWVNAVKPVQEVVVTAPWDKSGKKPSEYTWEEYMALSGEDQEKFYRWFDSIAAFETWVASVKPLETTVTTQKWNKSGKKPNEYTWAEYQDLSAEDQDSFSLWFPTEWDFEQWMAAARAREEETVQTWDKSGKKPNKYTWAEYEALSPEDQESFYQWFGSIEDFEAWMNTVKAEATSAVPEIWTKPGKNPNEYTWAEYEALSPQEQDLFFQWFGSVEAFEAWMSANK